MFVPKKPEKEVISIRIDSDILSIIDSVATDIDISRNELINQCIEFALQNLDGGSIKNRIHENKKIKCTHIDL